MPRAYDESMKKDLLKSSALLIVDVQNDFCPGGALPVPEGDKIVPGINQLSSLFGVVVATQDWHPPEHASFASQHAGLDPFDTTEIDGSSTVVWPDHCIQGTHGAAMHQDIDTRPIRLILRKGMNPRLDSYSAFFENDRTTGTGLNAYLKGMGVDTVFLCGLARDVCVFYSVIDARKLGYKSYLITDATRGVDVPPGNIERTDGEMIAASTIFINSDEILVTNT